MLQVSRGGCLASLLRSHPSMRLAGVANWNSRIEVGKGAERGLRLWSREVCHKEDREDRAGDLLF